MHTSSSSNLPARINQEFKAKTQSHAAEVSWLPLVIGIIIMIAGIMGSYIGVHNASQSIFTSNCIFGMSAMIGFISLAYTCIQEYKYGNKKNHDQIVKPFQTESSATNANFVSNPASTHANNSTSKANPTPTLEVPSIDKFLQYAVKHTPPYAPPVQVDRIKLSDGSFVPPPHAIELKKPLFNVYDHLYFGTHDAFLSLDPNYQVDSSVSFRDQAPTAAQKAWLAAQQTYLQEARACRKNIQHVISITSDSIPKGSVIPSTSGINFHQINIPEATFSLNTVKTQLPHIFKLIDDARAAKQNIMLFCHTAKRTLLIVHAYLIYHGATFEEAENYVKKIQSLRVLKPTDITELRAYAAECRALGRI